MPSKTKKRCPFCQKPMFSQYPGNDPECGPARLTCGHQWCDHAREAIAAAERYSLKDGTTLDTLHAEALEDDSIMRLYADVPDAYTYTDWRW